jgi:hypothetical protein
MGFNSGFKGLSTLSKLLEHVVAHRLNYFIRQNHIPPLEQLASVNNIQQSLNLLELPLSSPMVLILEDIQAWSYSMAKWPTLQTY